MQDRRGQVLFVAIFFAITSWISTILRVYVRKCMINTFGYDDLTMLITQFFFTAYIACQLGGVAYGTGQHRDKITDQNAEIALRYWWFCEVTYTFTTTLLKISIGLFLLRITINRAHIWIIRVVMIGSGVAGMVYTCIIVFQCKPLSYWWNLDPNAKGMCLSRSIFADTAYAASVLNSIADWTFGTLPIFIVKDLQMKRSSKVIVATILGLGAIGSTATIIRVPYIHTSIGYKGDFLWRTTDVAIWTTVEIGIGITAGCIATLKPLLVDFVRCISKRPSDSGEADKRGTARKWNGGVGHNQPLEPLRPAFGNSLTTTTIAGSGTTSLSHEGCNRWTYTDDCKAQSNPHHGIDSSSGESSKLSNSGIAKRIEIETTEEVGYV